IRVDENGSVYSLGSVGQASVLITDSGNDFYLPKQVRGHGTTRSRRCQNTASGVMTVANSAE
ncbi:hypothetical protein J4H24_23465, partial [Vibrio alginolyticus]|uniref:hypothetical protein n=1 Tax=Vibrio alginolyticus TaxID=663 RepID=UPI001BD4C548